MFQGLENLLDHFLSLLDLVPHPHLQSTIQIQKMTAEIFAFTNQILTLNDFKHKTDLITFTHYKRITWTITYSHNVLLSALVDEINITD